MNFGDTIEHGLAGAAAGIVGGPIGMALGLIGGIAPDLLGLFSPHLAGPEGTAVADAVVAAVTAATNGEAPTAAAVAGLSPDQRAQLQVQMATIAVQAEAARLADAAAARATELAALQAGLADTAGARAQTVDLAKEKSPIAWGAPIMSAIVLTTFGAMLGCLMTFKIPESALALANVMLGTLAAMATQAANYWMGSSAGSHGKDETIAAGQRALANSVPLK
jgi:hypothetical protein